MTTLGEKHVRQKRLLYIVIVAVLSGGIVLYFGFFKPPGAKVTEEPVFKKSKILESTGLDTAIFKDGRLTGLRPYTRLPREIETGRANPFSPYEKEAISSQPAFLEEEL